MWLVADSGSTKTEWVFFNQEREKKHVFSAGLNPLFLSSKEFNTEVQNSIATKDRLEISKLWFYGAGCGSGNVKENTKSWLARLFVNAIISVDTDLLAAARATCGVRKGLVAILGTGSNSCFFDGNSISRQIKPLGFILGDEGSGAALGKALLKKLLRNQFSPNLAQSIYQEIGMNYDELITKVYSSKLPNRFLASCAKVLHKFKSDEEVAELIETEFDQFAGVLIMYHTKLPVYIIGSVGFYFEEEITKSLEKNNLELGIIIKSPLKTLVNYHLKNN